MPNLRQTASLSLFHFFYTVFVSRFLLEIHKWEHKPVGLSGSWFLQAPCGNIDGLPGDVYTNVINFAKICQEYINSFLNNPAILLKASK